MKSIKYYVHIATGFWALNGLIVLIAMSFMFEPTYEFKSIDYMFFLSFILSALICIGVKE